MVYMHKTEIFNSNITFMKRLQYFKCPLSITTSYSQIFVFFYRKQFLLLHHHHHLLLSWSLHMIRSLQLKLLAASVVSNHSVEAEHAEWYIGATLWQIGYSFFYINKHIQLHFSMGSWRVWLSGSTIGLLECQRFFLFPKHPWPAWRLRHCLARAVAEPHCGGTWVAEANVKYYCTIFINNQHCILTTCNPRVSVFAWVPGTAGLFFLLLPQ